MIVGIAISVVDLRISIVISGTNRSAIVLRVLIPWVMVNSGVILTTVECVRGLRDIVV